MPHFFRSRGKYWQISQRREAENKTKKRPEALSRQLLRLFVQFGSHMHAVAGKRFGDFVRRSAGSLRLCGDFRFRAVHCGGGCGHGFSSEGSEEAAKAITATKVLMLFMI